MCKCLCSRARRVAGLCLCGMCGMYAAVTNLLWCAVGARVWGMGGLGGASAVPAERMDVEAARRSDELLAPVCPLAHSPVAIH